MLQYALPQPQSFSKPPLTFDPPAPSHSVASGRDVCSSRRSGQDIARPPSTVSDSAKDHSRKHTISGEEGGRSDSSSLPGLSALASLAATAANAPAAAMNEAHQHEASTRSSTPITSAMSQTAPAATAGYGSQQNGSAPPTCANCSTSTTPLWRRDESGSVLCNACGLFLKLHGRPRPISLKTDVIKSRNRVKTSSKKRDSHGEISAPPPPSRGYPPAHGQEAHSPAQHGGVPGHQHGLPMGAIAGHGPEQHHRAPSPSSLHRSSTPSSNPNIAPQHIFDTVSLPSDTFASPSLPHFTLRQSSPAPTLNGSHQSQSCEELVQQNNSLRTRVSELEVINDLFRGRVSELESSEQNSRDKQRTTGDDTHRLFAELATANARVAALERKLRELEEGPAKKKARTEEESSPAAETSSRADGAEVHAAAH